MSKKQFLFVKSTVRVSAVVLLLCAIAGCPGTPDTYPCKPGCGCYICGTVTPLIFDGGILPVNMFSDRNPGRPDGIPNVTEVYITLNSAAAASDINAAIIDAGTAAQNTGKPQVVQLTAGTFNLDSQIRLNRSNVILRGMGSETILVTSAQEWHGAISIGQIEFWNDNNNPVVIKSVTNSPKTGDKSITVNNTSGLRAGDILILDRLANDNGDITGRSGGTEFSRGAHSFFRQPQPNSNNGPATTGRRVVKQYIEIESVSGNTLNLVNAVNIDFPAKLKPEVWKTRAGDFRNIGLEDLVVRAVNGSSHRPVIQMQISSSYSWIKNVRSDGRHGFFGVHIRMQGFRNTVTGCFVHHSAQPSYGGTAYGIEIMGGDGLIDNNIADMLNKPILGYASGGGNVIAYNFVANTTIHPENWLETAINASHSSYSHSDLYEGNYAPNISTDSTGGNNGFIVFFRNHARGYNLNGLTTSNLRAADVQAWSNEHFSIGNVWLQPPNLRPQAIRSVYLWDTPLHSSEGGQNRIAVYQIGRGGWNNSPTGNNSDGGWAYRRFHRHLDFNYADNDIYINPVNPIETLPESLYRLTAPDYFAGYTWPPVNPHGTDHDKRVPGLPAQTRYFADAGYN